MTKGSHRLPFVASTLLAAGALAVGGCADVSGDALQQDVAQLRQDLNSLTLNVHRSRGDTETVVGQLDRRTREQSAETNKQLSALNSRLDALSQDVARVSARIDDLSQRVDTLARQSAPSGAPAPSGGAAPSGGSGAIPPPARTGAGPAPAPSVAAIPPARAGASAEESYQAAYLDFSKGLYPLAVSGFRDFLRRFPDSPLADSAQYWIGEAYFSMARATANQPEKARENMEQAVQEFRKVVVAYPRGSKVPTALYKEALALVELKQTALAQSRLQYLVDHFPQSEEAPLAKERLASLKE
ncbi:MAG TPA: tetratricopeptide repeat protein [Methylomirabilota bacterium]|nr:tetratricopeptide repeat protein [Methylomirabilota bacterium]